MDCLSCVHKKCVPIILPWKAEEALLSVPPSDTIVFITLPYLIFYVYVNSLKLPSEIENYTDLQRWRSKQNQG